MLYQEALRISADIEGLRMAIDMIACEYFDGHVVLFEAENRDLQLLCESMVPVFGVAARLAEVSLDEMLDCLTRHHDAAAYSMQGDFVSLARAEALVIFGDGRHALTEVRAMIVAGEDDTGFA